MIKNITALFAVFILFSCSTEPVSKPGQEQVVIQQSSALRVSLEGIKKQEQAEKSAITTKKGPEDELCFQFIYPVTLSYNTGTTVEVTSYENLLERLQPKRRPKGQNLRPIMRVRLMEVKR